MLVPEELLTYIRNEQSKGVAPEIIQNALKTAGWLEEDIKNAFASLGQSVISLTKKTPWYGVLGYEGILNWKALILVFLIPFANLLYPLYLIVISAQKKSFALFWVGLKQYLIVFLTFSLIGIALILGMVHSYNALF
jgi:hypothetical protein